MKYGILLAFLSISAPSYACPMADAAAYKTAHEKVVKAEGTQLAFHVKGMTCGSCSEKVNKAIQEVEGVVASAVDYQTGEVRIAYDGRKTTEKTLTEALKKTGYKVKKVNLEG